MKVVVAMSGGVDSAVAAARVKEAGHEVTAVHLAMSRSQNVDGRSRGCCSVTDGHDARRVADQLDVPFYVWNVNEIFYEKVISDFIDSYQAGKTPNPCVRCNEHIKFAHVLQRTRALGFDALATGHYAQVRQGVDGNELHRSVDVAKDQSYVLAVMKREDLDHVIFPVGDSSKPAVREEAARRGLRVATKPDSYDICFIPSGDSRAWLKERIGTREGEVVHAVTGEPLGTHGGVHTLTIGQRRGLTVDQRSGPFYVTALDAENNVALAGEAELLDVHHFQVVEVNWLAAPRRECLMQIRAHQMPVPAEVLGEGCDVTVRLETPLRAVAPGQTAVWYEDSQVIGTGTIKVGS